MNQTCPVCLTPVDPEMGVCPKCNFRLSGTTQQFNPIENKSIPIKIDDSPALESFLRMVRGQQVGVEYPLNKDLLTIGRNPGSDIFLNDMTVSREHAEIHRHADAFIIKDLHSFNGVWINNKTVDQHALRPGDYVQIGRYDFIYEEKETGR